MRDETAETAEGTAPAREGQPPSDRVELSDEDWRRRLSPKQFRVLRQADTDPPFSGRFTHPGATGTYTCAACGAKLFDSTSQFDSGSGWPSFTQPVDADRVELRRDLSHGMVRTEVICRRCGSHLGHVFDDGPGPTGQRWCINSTSLDLGDEKGADEAQAGRPAAARLPGREPTCDAGTTEFVGTPVATRSLVVPAQSGSRRWDTGCGASVT